MTLIVGGRGQGKLVYAKTMLGVDETQVSFEPARPSVIVAGLETWLKTHPAAELEQLLKASPEVTILCDEVGCGVTPMDREEREWRERVGRVCCELAARADCVIRMMCGIPTILKGEPKWI